jgi:hypothetical protein
MPVCSTCHAASHSSKQGCHYKHGCPCKLGQSPTTPTLCQTCPFKHSQCRAICTQRHQATASKGSWGITTAVLVAKHQTFHACMHCLLMSRYAAMHTHNAGPSAHRGTTRLHQRARGRPPGRHHPPWTPRSRKTAHSRAQHSTAQHSSAEQSSTTQQGVVYGHGTA